MTPTRTGGTGQTPAGSLTRRRVLLGTATSAVAAVDLAAKAWAESSLPAGGVEAGPVDLRLGYNSGVAFSVGADAPAVLVVAITAAVTTVVALIAWRTARAGDRTQLTALALLLGGAVANLADRAGDGVVTDYLHTGWWPTFNLADAAIVTGALLVTAATWRRGPSHDRLRRTGTRKGTAPLAWWAAAALGRPGHPPSSPPRAAGGSGRSRHDADGSHQEPRQRPGARAAGP